MTFESMIGRIYRSQNKDSGFERIIRMDRVEIGWSRRCRNRSPVRSVGRGRIVVRFRRMPFAARIPRRRRRFALGCLSLDWFVVNRRLLRAVPLRTFACLPSDDGARLRIGRTRRIAAVDEGDGVPCRKRADGRRDGETESPCPLSINTYFPQISGPQDAPDRINFIFLCRF